MDSEQLLLSSATRLAELIRTGQVTATEVVAAHIRHIERVNPILNAVVCDRFASALAEAAAADDLTRTTPPDALPPLHGVPCTIKEAFALTGMPNSSGLVARRLVVASADATAVARLRRAGAIPLGVTNVSELCMWMESDNRVYGRTNNPYDPQHIAGGSSGGEGAIIGAGGSPFGLGADIAGSIRLPAFCNGVFGHKPTGGLVPNTGQYPMAVNEAGRYLTTGPLARRAEDLMPLLSLLAGPDGIDPTCAPMSLGDPARVAIDALHVIDVPDNGVVGAARSLLRAQAEAALALGRLGARVQRRSFVRLRRTFQIWSAMLAAAGGPTFSELLGCGTPIRRGRGLLRWVLRRSPHTLPALGLAVFEDVPKLFPGAMRRAIAAGQALKEELVDALGASGVMLFPSFPEPAPRHLTPLVKLKHWTYTAVFNVLELPVTQVPLGLDRRGLPLGVQVAAAPGNDHLSIAVALALERAFGGWVPPPLFWVPPSLRPRRRPAEKRGERFHARLR